MVTGRLCGLVFFIIGTAALRVGDLRGFVQTAVALVLMLTASRAGDQNHHVFFMPFLVRFCIVAMSAIIVGSLLWKYSRLALNFMT